MTSHLFESLKYRLHVRNLLYDYVKQHCTTDYLTFTEGLVSEFLEDLQPVPLTDSYSLTIPVDPLDAVETLYADSPSYSPDNDNVLPTSQEAVKLLKEVVKASGNPKTERVVWDSCYGPAPRQELLYPALTRRARQRTKTLGKDNRKKPQTVRDVVREQKFGLVTIEEVQEPVVDFEDTLGLKLAISPEEQPAVRSLLQSTLAALRPDEAYRNRYLDPTSLSNDFSGKSSYRSPEEVFIPIFPRKRRSGNSSTAAPTVPITDFKSLLDNKSILFKPVEVVGPEESIHLQNLVVVDGWETIRSSPPSTPSRTGSDEEIDELDEIRFPSSPNTTPPLVQEIEESKMDEILIPRSRRIGGRTGIKPHILRGETLRSFLLPLVPRGRTETEDRCEVERMPSPAPSSLLGQPPSVLAVAEMGNDADTQHDDYDLEPELQNLYERHELEHDFILNETIDDKHALLMEVPNPPQPNEFPKDFHVPQSFSDFLILSTTNNAKNSSTLDVLPPQRFLKKVKGCQSLSLALSWVPFTTDRQLPTVLEAVDVVDLFPQETPDYAQAMKLLGFLIIEEESTIASLDSSVRRVLEPGPDYPVYKPPSEDFHILLNRQERTRLAKLEGPVAGYEADDSDVSKADHAFEDGDLAVPILGSDARDVEQERADRMLRLPSGEAKPSRKPRPEIHDGRNIRDVSSLSDILDDESATDEKRNAHAGAFDQTKENWSQVSSSVSFDTQLHDELAHGLGPVGHTADFVRGVVSATTSSVATDDEEGFEPLLNSSHPAQLLGSALRGAPSHSDPQVDGRSDVAYAHIDRRPLNFRSDFDMSCEPELARHSLGIAAFARLRAKKIIEPEPSLVASPVLVPSLPVKLAPERPPRGPPAEICDSNTITLPELIVIPQSAHKYMASLNFIQRQALVRALCSNDCAVELVERQDLGDVDLILDTKTAVVFLNLFSLPARCDVCVERVARAGWKFDRLLVVLEAYGELSAKKSRARGHPCLSSSPYAYTPPILKAVKKFRRDLSIAEGCGTKRAVTVVHYAFADTVEEAALLTRMYGDWVEAEDETDGAIWGGGRNWMDADYLEEELSNLASLNGLNHFSASVILCQVSLQEFVDLSPEERISAFGAYIDPEHIRECNEDLEARFAAMQAAQLSSGTLSDVDMR